MMQLEIYVFSLVGRLGKVNCWERVNRNTYLSTQVLSGTRSKWVPWCTFVKFKLLEVPFSLFPAVLRVTKKFSKNHPQPLCL